MGNFGEQVCPTPEREVGRFRGPHQLAPPGWPGAPENLPHWPYAQAVDQALTAEGVSPGVVRVSHAAHQHGGRTYLILMWNVSRTGGRGGTGRRRRAGHTP